VSCCLRLYWVLPIELFIGSIGIVTRIGFLTHHRGGGGLSLSCFNQDFSGVQITFHHVVQVGHELLILCQAHLLALISQVALHGSVFENLPI
jgi:hypothetical protein